MKVFKKNLPTMGESVVRRLNGSLSCQVALAGKFRACNSRQPSVERLSWNTKLVNSNI